MLLGSVGAAMMTQDPALPGDGDALPRGKEAEGEQEVVARVGRGTGQEQELTQHIVWERQG